MERCDLATNHWQEYPFMYVKCSDKITTNALKAEGEAEAYKFPSIDTFCEGSQQKLTE